MKNCSKCGELKSPESFREDKRLKSALKSWCKACDKAIYRALDHDAVSAYAAAYRAANADKIKARDATRRHRYRAGSPWYEANKVRLRAKTKAYVAANKEKVSVRRVAYRATHKEANRRYSHNRRAKVRDVGGKLSDGISAKLYKLQRGKCACCSRPLNNLYHLDHITPLALGGTNTDDNIQLLRPLCNYQKWTKDPIEFMQGRGFLL